MLKITIYRRDSHTPIIYENIKHCWWEGDNFILAQVVENVVDITSGTGKGTHNYWTWCRELISHIKEERLTPKETYVSKHD